MFPISTRILIVDDVTGVRQMLKAVLRQMGFQEVTGAENGKTALEFMDRAMDEGKPVELILSDWNMPVLSGLEFLKRVRAHPAYSKIPFLMVTAEGEFNSVKEALTFQVNGYVVKPFGPAALEAKLQTVWKQLEAAKAKASQ